MSEYSRIEELRAVVAAQARASRYRRTRRFDNQGNLKGVPSIAEPLHVALENGAIRAIVPISNKSQFTSLPEETVENLDVIFYRDVDRAILKSVEL